MPTDERRRKWEARGVVYDDQQDEAVAVPTFGKVPWPKQADELDCRWVPGARGWLTVRDPFTLERHEVPTKYAEGLPSGTERAPQEWVRRAMDKLPPKRGAR